MPFPECDAATNQYFGERHARAWRTETVARFDRSAPGWKQRSASDHVAGDVFLARIKAPPFCAVPPCSRIAALCCTRNTCRAQMPVIVIEECSRADKHALVPQIHRSGLALTSKHGNSNFVPKIDSNSFAECKRAFVSPAQPRSAKFHRFERQNTT